MRKTLPDSCILIPDNASKVFSGQIFEVYQWDQTLFTGNSATFEMLRRPDTMLIIAIKGESIVMIEDEQPHRSAMLGLPGGRAEDTDASWEDAAARELLEETGMIFKSWKLIDVMQPVRKIEWFAALYIASDFETQVEQALDAGEKIQIKEVDFQTFRSMVYEEISEGVDRDLGHLRELLLHAHSVRELLAIPSFRGKEVDRS